MIRLADLFDEIDLFTGMAFADLQTLAGYFRIVSTTPDQVLFREGEPGDAMYIVLEGRIRISKQIDGELRPLAVEGRGKVFGEMALLDGEQRSATCAAVGSATVAMMDLSALERLEKEHPAIALRFLKRVMRLVSRRLRMTTGKLAQQLS